MNLYQLQQFLFVAEEGSVTRGAERAAVSQPAMSRGIADLESAVGERLFDRGPKGVTPTEAGRVLLGYARRIFALDREAEEALADLRGLRSGRLAIGASTTLGDFLIPDLVAVFLTDHPGVEVSMEVANTEAIQEGVLQGRYDVGFTEGEVDEERFEVRSLGQDRLVVVAAPNHRLAGLTADVEELRGEGFVMRESGSGTRAVVESGLAKAGLSPRTLCELGSTAAIKAAVARGLGLGVASVLAVQAEVSRGELAVVETTFRLTRDLHVVRLGWRRESVALRAFLRTLQECLGGPPTLPPNGNQVALPTDRPLPAVNERM